MTKIVYRVIVKVSYYSVAFDFNSADEAGNFAKTLLLHQAATGEDEDKAASVRMEVYMDENPEDRPVKHDGCEGCAHSDKSEDEYPCCYCMGTRTDRYEKKED